MNDDASVGDPITEVFDPKRIDARFVVAMSMARNDIEVSVRDGIAAAQENRPDFTYRVRLVTSHLVEALDSLNAYSHEEDVKKLVARVPAEAKEDLSKARSALQKVGAKVLDQVRNNTFHYPSPKTNYTPTSDEQLRDILSGMGDRACELHLDHRGEHPIFTLSFAHEVALALALAKHSADENVGREQFEITSAGAIGFKHWVDALVVTYLDATGGHFGTPRVIEDHSPARGGDPGKAEDRQEP
jgi:hypothetical protein